jgi:hypothetical protein
MVTYMLDDKNSIPIETRFFLLATASVGNGISTPCRKFIKSVKLATLSSLGASVRWRSALSPLSFYAFMTWWSGTRTIIISNQLLRRKHNYLLQDLYLKRYYSMKYILLMIYRIIKFINKWKEADKLSLWYSVGRGIKSWIFTQTLYNC